jgi:hypothetical protein
MALVKAQVLHTDVKLLVLLGVGVEVWACAHKTARKKKEKTKESVSPKPCAPVNCLKDEMALNFKWIPHFVKL